MTTKQLTLFEAAAVIAGLGIGGGIMAVPYLAAQNGIMTVLMILCIAFGLSLLLHLMLAEVVLKEERPIQLVELIRQYVFIGKFEKPLTWIFFFLLVGGVYVQLTGYIVGCAEILLDLVGFPLIAGEILSYVIAAGVVFFGLKAIGFIEKYAIIGIALLLIVLTAGSWNHPFTELPLLNGGAREAMAFYGMAMFSFGAWFSVPQAVEGLQQRRHLVPWAVALGIGLNFAFVSITTLMAWLVSHPVTPIAISGWGSAVGDWALVLGSLVVFLSMLTSYWAFSYALAVILQERIEMNFRRAWLIATVPTLVIAVTGLTNFLGFMRLTGGLSAVLIAVLVIPMLRSARKRSSIQATDFELRKLGSTPFQVLILLAYLMMAIGSLIPIEP